MPAPLLWLGAACISLYASNKANNEYMRRKGIVQTMPGDTDFAVEPKNGAIVRCGIYGVLDHTGIWVDGNIYELSGQGLVRCLSPERFLGDRSGSRIYVACSDYGEALHHFSAVKTLKSKLFTLQDYHLLNQNCHKFVAETLTNHEVDITSFSELNSFLHDFFQTTIHWHPIITK